MGRPKGDHPPLEGLATRVPPELAAFVRDIAKQERRTVSQILRIILEQMAKAQEESCQKN